MNKNETLKLFSVFFKRIEDVTAIYLNLKVAVLIFVRVCNARVSRRRKLKMCTDKLQMIECV